MSDQDLMQSIRTKWGAMINAACAMSNVSPAFVAALIANESGGNADAKRFEKGVLAALWEVLLGRKAAYGSIGRADLVSYVTGLPNPPVSSPSSLPADAFQRVDALATSWGLTQIMGYEALDRVLNSGGIQNLKTPPADMVVSLRMLSQFATRNGLDVAKDFSEMFSCWNTGRPHAPTFDPNYIPNGLARMKIYEEILANETDPGT